MFMIKSGVSFVILCSLLSGSLMAQDQFTTQSQSVKPKDAGTAILIATSASVIVPLIGISTANSNSGSNAVYGFWIGAAVIGVIVGPSAGKLYAADYKGAMTGIVVRSVISGIIALQLSGKSDKNASFGPDEDALFLLGVGSVACAASMLHSILTTPRSVREYNQKHNLSVMPAFDPRSRSARLFVSVDF